MSRSSHPPRQDPRRSDRPRTRRRDGSARRDFEEDRDSASSGVSPHARGGHFWGDAWMRYTAGGRTDDFRRSCEYRSEAWLARHGYSSYCMARVPLADLPARYRASSLFEERLAALANP